MEIKRYLSIYFLSREMDKDLFGIDVNNSTDKVSSLSLQLTNFNNLSECKKINIDKWKKIN